MEFMGEQDLILENIEGSISDGVKVFASVKGDINKVDANCELLEVNRAQGELSIG